MTASEWSDFLLAHGKHDTLPQTAVAAIGTRNLLFPAADPTHSARSDQTRQTIEFWADF